MRFQGRITDWRDHKGFGFITPNGGGERVFVHIKSFSRAGRRPAQDDRVNYTVERDDKGRLRAAGAELVVKQRASYSARASKSGLLAFAGGWMFLIVALALMGKVPHLVAFVYVGASVLTFGAYALDKAAARADRWRTQESTLHTLGLLGGWPGALFAQQLLRHKSQKASFISVFWASVVVNVVALAWLLSPYGRAFTASIQAGNG